MKNIVINYKISKNIDNTTFNKIISGCVSEKYKVFLNLYDFSLSKDTKEYTDQLSAINNLNINYIPQNFEDVKEADQIILGSLIQYGDSVAFGIFGENTILNTGGVDLVDFNLLAEEINGFIYFDYNIKNIRCFLRSRSTNIQLNVPAIFWSTSKLIRYIPEKEKLNIVGNNYGSIHIPYSLCTIYPDEK